MAKSSKKEFQTTEEMLLLALNGGMHTNRQMVLSMEKALKRSLISMSQHQVDPGLCDDIRALLDLVEQILKEEIELRGGAASGPSFLGPAH